MKKYITYIAAFVLTGSILKAQDFHVSQYDVTSMYVNPALTGMYGDEKGDYKAYIDTRSQWRAFGVKPFFTTYLAYDMPYTIKEKKVGFGAYFINNRTGPGNFNTTGFMLSGAYNILDKKANGVHYLTTGLQLGLFYKAFNNDITYDVQYDPYADGGSFNQNISSGENANNIAHQREHFALLSKDLNDLIVVFGTKRKLYQAFCPMYDDKKGAIWLSENKEIKNPYYGSKMLSCGSIQKDL